MVDAQQMQQRCLEVVHVHAVGPEKGTGKGGKGVGRSLIAKEAIGGDEWARATLGDISS